MKTTPIPKDYKDNIHLILCALYFVRWDRFVVDNKKVSLYGWMDRNDNNKDFIVLDYIGTKTGYRVEYITSSAHRDDEIDTILEIKPNDGNKCQRIEHNFKIKNVIKLKQYVTTTK